MKQIILTKSEIIQAQSIRNIDEFIRFLKPYYPDVPFKELSITEIEKSLYQSYFKLIGKILVNSSDELRSFLRHFLMKYEIYNIKLSILGTILNKTKKEKLNDTNFLIEELLDNEAFIKDLIEKRSINEIELFLKNTSYYQVIKEGLDFYRNNKEIFVLATSLDRLYYENLSRIKSMFNKEDFEIIKKYINYVSEIYNIKILYRGIKNKIEKSLLGQLIVDNYLFLNSKKLNILLNQETIEGFILHLNNFLINYKPNVFSPDVLNKKYEDIITIIKIIYDEYFLKECKQQMNSLASISISKVLEILVKKEKEIKEVIIPFVVDLLHSKYQSL